MRVRKLGSSFWAILVGVLVISLIVNVFLYMELSELRKEATYLPLIGISKQSSTVRQYLDLYPNAQCSVRRLFLKSDGKVYSVDDNWELGEHTGYLGEPTDGKDHYCWGVRWSSGSGWMDFVAVYIDRDSWEIVLVEATWQPHP